MSSAASSRRQIFRRNADGTLFFDVMPASGVMPTGFSFYAPLMFSDAGAAETALSASPAAAEVLPLADGIPWWLKPLATPSAAENGAIRDAAIQSEMNYEARRQELAFESGATTVSPGEVNSAPAAVRAAVNHELRKQYLANAYKNEEEA